MGVEPRRRCRRQAGARWVQAPSGRAVGAGTKRACGEPGGWFDIAAIQQDQLEIEILSFSGKES